METEPRHIFLDNLTSEQQRHVEVTNRFSTSAGVFRLAVGRAGDGLHGFQKPTGTTVHCRRGDVSQTPVGRLERGGGSGILEYESIALETAGTQRKLFTTLGNIRFRSSVTFGFNSGTTI